MEIDKIERGITDFWTTLIKTLLFFLNGNQQSLFVSVIHYIIFIVGFYGRPIENERNAAKVDPR